MLLGTEWGLSLGESPWDESEAWQDRGASGQKDEIFSDARFGFMPKLSSSKYLPSDCWITSQP